MIGILTNVLRWLFSKAAMLLVIWTLVLGGFALYLASQKYLERLPEELADKERVVQRIQEEASLLEEKVAALKQDLDEKLKSVEAARIKLQRELEVRQGQMRAWQDQLAALKGVKARALEFWNKLRGVDTEKQQSELSKRINESRAKQADLLAKAKDVIAQREAIEDSAGSHELKLQEEREGALERLTVAKEERDRVKSEADRWEGRVAKSQDFLEAAFEKVGKPLIWLSLSIIFLPILAKIALYYFWAPLLSFGRPVALKTAAHVPIRVTKTAVAQQVVLETGESATIQHKFYQASDEDLIKKTKFVFSWKYPFSCLAAGLFLLTRVTNRVPGAQRRLTLSSQTDAEVEMAVVEVPEGGAVVCRPSFLAALIQNSGDEEPRVRSHWRFFSLHAWITLQFRYFEFRGPVKLVVWAYRGVRAERLTVYNVQEGNERRTNQLATIGFTPSLSYRSRRSETFISYLRDHNPLFDDLFSGQGVFLCQQVSRAEHHRQAGNFWAKIWNGLTKIIGL
jgi:hypothetical protein